MTVTQSRATERKDARPLPGHRVRLGADRPLRLGCGAELHDFSVAYQTYGSLNRDKSNAVLVCHALTGDQFVAGLISFGPAVPMQPPRMLAQMMK